MSRKKSFVKELTVSEISSLEVGKKTGKSFSFRTRCHAILLSHKGYEIGQISDILEVHRSSIYTWFSSWKKDGIQGLKTKKGQGRKPTLCIDNQRHVEAVKDAVKKRAKTGENLLTTIEDELEMEGELSMTILRPFLKKLISYGNAFEKV
jgi:transposase